VKKTWEGQVIELEPETITNKAYAQRIAEISEALYSAFCQLDDNEDFDPESMRTSSSFTYDRDTHPANRRTGTHD
jgi:hypothetical protein